MTKTPLTNESVSRAFHHLAEEHFAPDAKRDEATWQKIQQRREQKPANLHVVSKPRLSKYRFVGAAALVSAAAAGAVMLFAGTRTHEPEKLSYSVNMAFPVKDKKRSVEQTIAGDPRGDLIASEDQEVKLNFSDSSRATLAPHTTLRLTTTDAPARVDGRLAQGRITFEGGQKPTEGAQAPTTQVRLSAGTFRLNAVGASFIFSYLPGESEVRLMTQAGVVQLTDTTGRVHEVRESEKLTLSERQTPDRDQEAPTSTPQSERVGGHDNEAHQIGDVAQVSDKALTSTEALSKAESRLGPTFAELAAEGKFAEVVASARSQGLSQLLASSPASELQELAQAARYTGNTTLATQVWTQIASRFSGTAAGRNAQFFLGRLAEQQGDNQGALSHYGNYLGQSGGSLYMAEALGRKLDLVQKIQGNRKALPVAREYLRLFPQGPYARTARDIVGAD